MNWLLLRGLARQSGHWGDFPDYLETALPRDRVYRLDLPGTGSRYQELSPTTIPEIRAKVQAAAESLPRPLILVGLSMGGMVALDWAVSQPEGLAGVVVINSSSGLSPPWHRLQIRQWHRVIGMLTLMNTKRRESAILELTCNTVQPSGLISDWCDLQHQSPVARRTALRQILAAACYRPAIEKPTTPCLLLASRGDRLVSVQCSQTLATRWRCAMKLHDWAGHDLPLDDPDWVIARLLSFREALD